MNTDKPIFYPIIDNGMGLSVTGWAISMLGALRGESVFCHLSTPYPGYAMDIATKQFLESECDEMIVIDTDLVFKPQDLAHLREHDEPLVFGLYSKRTVRFDPPVVPIVGQEKPAEQPGVLWEVQKTARGFMRVHRSVFEKMRPHAKLMEHTEFGPMHSYWPTSQDGTSEDFAFCAQWRELGGRVLIDKRVFVGHVGQAKFPIMK
jgi:hypothetical protein